ncbi:hypothetical protein PTSG_10028 [Salpingoeca rosetta]|uniref:Uncharacterized protein n=1 Tax=Salpingoeca rosetta (strain ATCC 50818 / BSB-021) TaxID=946362 RepID=F2UPA7_SALR5|nr:uncharacterized protein PTSG_10028 [Salpingoeca rosetta]EGD79462.1 hypothetical protein PTSG_10028 [Salpingoeca rosetta]|eukprot:XP_004988943.1 hypothetical protein PTSG_10028 [Salpingoeca rosetta]
MPCCPGRKTKRQSVRMQRQEMTERALQQEREEQSNLDLEEDTAGVQLSEVGSAAAGHQDVQASAEYIKTIARVFELAKEQEAPMATAQAYMMNAIERASAMLSTCEDKLKACDSQLGEWAGSVASATEGENTDNAATIEKMKNELLITSQLRSAFVLAWTQANEDLKSASSWCTKAAEACTSFIEPARQLEEDGRSPSDMISVWFTEYVAAMNKLHELYNDLGAMCTSCLHYIDDPKFSEDFITDLHEQILALPTEGSQAEGLGALDERLTRAGETAAQLRELVAAQVESISAAPRSHFETLEVVNGERLSLDKEYFSVLLTPAHSIDVTLLEDLQAYELAGYGSALACAAATDCVGVANTMLERAKQHVTAVVDACGSFSLADEHRTNTQELADKVTAPSTVAPECLSTISEQQAAVVSTMQSVKADILAASSSDTRAEDLKAAQQALVPACEEVFSCIDRFLKDEDKTSKSVIAAIAAIDDALAPLTTQPVTALGLTAGGDDEKKQGTDAIAFITELVSARHCMRAVANELRPESDAPTELNDKMEEMFDVAFFLVDTALAYSAKDPRTIKLVAGYNKTLGLKLQTSHGTRGIRVVGTALNSQARRTCNVYPGDAVCKVNGVDVTQEMHNEVVHRIAEHQGPIEFELARDFPPARRYLTLTRSSELGLGFQLVLDGGRPKIKEVVPNSPAFETQQMKPGQFLLEVDGETTEGMSLQEVSNMLRTRTEVNICVGPYPSDTTAAAGSKESNVERAVEQGDEFDTAAAVLQSISVPPPESESPPDCRTVTFKRSEGVLGMRLKSLQNRPGVYIVGFVADSLADKCPELHENDYIVAVGGQNVVQASHETVVNLIKNYKEDEISITVSSYDPLEWANKRRSTAGATEDAVQAAATETATTVLEQAAGAANTPPPQQQQQQSGEQSGEQDLPRRTVTLKRTGKDTLGLMLTVQQPSGCVAILGAVSGSPADAAGVMPGEVLYSVNGQQLQGMQHSDVIDTLRQTEGDVVIELQDPPVPPVDYVRTVKLHRGRGESLGLRLQSRGPRGNTFIVDMLESGAASRVKTLFLNDQIISVNGASIEDMEHDQVVQLLVNAGQEIVLEVKQASPQQRAERVPVNAAAATGERTTLPPDEGVEDDATRGPGSSVTVLDVTDEDRAAFPNAVDMRKVTLHRSSATQHFGLQFSLKNYVAKIQTIVPNQLAAMSNTLRENDIILNINGQHVYKQPVDLRAAIQSSNDVTLLVAAQMNEPEQETPATQMAAAASAATATEPTTTAGAAGAAATTEGKTPRTVRLVKRDGRRLGLVLLPYTPEQTGVQVYALLPDGCAYDQGIEAGDRIVAINGTDVSSAPHSEAIQLLSTGSEFELSVLSGETEDVHLKRESPSSSFGLALAPLHNTSGAVVGEVLPDSPAQRSGKMHTGDIILLVDGKMAGQVTKNDVAEMLANKTETTLTLLRCPMCTSGAMARRTSRRLERMAKEEEEAADVFTEGSEQGTQAPPPAGAGGARRGRVQSFRRVNSISFEKSEGARLGMRLRPSDNYNRGAIVEEVIPGGLAEKHGVVRGDRLLALDGKSVVDTPHADIVKALNTRSTCTIKFDSNAKRNEQRQTVILRKRPNETLGIRLRSEGGRTYVHELVPDSVASDSMLQVNDEILSVNGVRVVGLSNEDMTRLFSQEGDIVVVAESPAPPLSPEGVEMTRRMSQARRNHEYRAPGLRKVVLVRGDGEHFGVEIGMTSKAHGVIITKLHDNGIAAKDGRLRSGDAVLAMNGKSMLHPMPEEARDALASTGNRLELVVADDFPEQDVATRLLTRETAKIAWGLTLRKIEGKDGVHVLEIVPNSPAATAGLRPDDRVMKVDGQDVEHGEATNVLKHFANKLSVQVTVRRPAVVPGALASQPDQPQQRRQQQQQQQPRRVSSGAAPGRAASGARAQRMSIPSAPPTATHLPPAILRKVDLVKQPGTRLGLAVSTDDKGTVVKTVTPGGLAAATGNVHVGDVILSINHMDVTAATAEEVSDILSQSPRVQLVLADRYPHYGRAPSDPSTVVDHPAHGPYELRVFRLRKSSTRLGLVLETRKYDNITVVKSVGEDSFAAEAGIRAGDVVLAISGRCVEQADHKGVLDAVSENAELVLVVARNVLRRVTFRRGGANNTLGLTLTSAPEGVLTIANIIPNSPAAETGLLFPSDRVLEANGVDMRGKTLDEATALLQDSDEVTLTVEPLGAITYQTRQAESVAREQDAQRSREQQQHREQQQRERQQHQQQQQAAVVVGGGQQQLASVQEEDEEEEEGEQEQEGKGVTGNQQKQQQQQQDEAVTKREEEDTPKEQQHETTTPQAAASGARVSELEKENEALSEQVARLKLQLKRASKAEAGGDDDGHRHANGIAGLVGAADDEEDEDDGEEADIIDDESFVVLGSSLTEEQMRALAADEDMEMAEHAQAEQQQQQEGEKDEEKTTTTGAGEATGAASSDDANAEATAAAAAAAAAEAEKAKEALNAAQAENDRLRQQVKELEERAKESENKLKEEEQKSSRPAAPAIDPSTLQQLEDKLEDACMRADAEQLARQQLEVELSQAQKELAEAKANLTDKALADQKQQEQEEEEEAKKKKEDAEQDKAQADAQAQEAQEEKAKAAAAEEEAARLREELDGLRSRAEEDQAKMSEQERTIQSLRDQLAARQPSPSASKSPRKQSTSGRASSPLRTYRPAPDDPVDKAVARIVNDMHLAAGSVERHQPKQYRFFGDSKLVHIRTVGNVVMARVGGGWQNLREYIRDHENQRVHRPIATKPM